MNDQEEKQYINEEGEASFDARMKKAQQALKRCNAEKAEYLAGWQRSQADFQNYKKQQGAELEEFRKFVNSNLILRILPVLDNLMLTSSHMPENERETAWAKGIVNICRQFEGILKDEGVEEIPVQIGDVLNPEIHEAIGEIEGEGGSGTVGEVAQRGYSLYGRVVRVARVKIYK